jgi:1,2-diacylglycerol 3-alpha-glucosyltransferase
MTSHVEPSRLRIAMVLDAWEGARTGAVISTRRFVALLRERGHTVTILSTGDAAPGLVPLRELYIPFANGIIKKMRVSLAWPNRRIIQETLGQQDLIHVHFPFFLAARAITLARKAGVPVVSTFHVQAEHVLHNIGIQNQKAVDWLYRLFLAKVYNRSNRVICPSKFAEEELRRYGLTADVTVISNGVLPTYRPIPSEQRPNFDGKFVILSVGRFAPEKRHELLIEAVRRSRYAARIQLVLIGDGPLRSRLEDAGKSLSNPVRFFYLSPEELVPYYNAADLYVHAADIEVECMTVLEAMGCGAPCLIAQSRKSATAQFAQSEAFLFKSGSMEDLTAKIDYWFEHPRELGEARTAYRRAAGDYRIEASLEKLLAVYRDVTEAGPQEAIAAPAA